VRWGLVPRGRRGENERSLEKRIEGVAEAGHRGRMRLSLQVHKKRGKKLVQKGQKQGLQERSQQEMGGSNKREVNEQRVP